jgi:hypothetical protein
MLESGAASGKSVGTFDVAPWVDAGSNHARPRPTVSAETDCRNRWQSQPDHDGTDGGARFRDASVRFRRERPPPTPWDLRRRAHSRDTA